MPNNGYSDSEKLSPTDKKNVSDGFNSVITKLIIIWHVRTVSCVQRLSRNALATMSKIQGQAEIQHLTLTLNSETGSIVDCRNQAVQRQLFALLNNNVFLRFPSHPPPPTHTHPHICIFIFVVVLVCVCVCVCVCVGGWVGGCVGGWVGVGVGVFTRSQESV